MDGITTGLKNDKKKYSGITPARRAQLLYDLIDGVDLLLVIGR